jgi:8-oxo-dGTP pyrophosphatase MutT (NUDIX family)
MNKKSLIEGNLYHNYTMQATLCFVFNAQWQILLCMKKRWFGEGKRNGAGGKQLDWETIEQTAIREFQEETWVEIAQTDLIQQWLLHFSRPHKPEWNQIVHVFLWKKYQWEPIETEEMRPQWWNIDAIPYDSMRDDDIIRLPRFIWWENFEYECIFDEKNKIYSSKVIL